MVTHCFEPLNQMTAFQVLSSLMALFFPLLIFHLEKYLLDIGLLQLKKNTQPFSHRTDSLAVDTDTKQTST